MNPDDKKKLLENAIAHVAQAIDIALSFKLDPDCRPGASEKDKLKELEGLLEDALFTLNYVNGAEPKTQECCLPT